MLHLVPKTMKGGDRYNLIVSSCAPRPIAFVSSVDKQGANANLAPFSYFNVVSHNPPLVVISIVRNADGSKKDTLKNVESSGEFVVNMISESFVQQANSCATNFPYGVDEMAATGLHGVKSHVLKCGAQRVKEALVSYECKTVSLTEIKGYDSETVSTTLILGLFSDFCLAVFLPSFFCLLLSFSYFFLVHF